MKEYTQTDLVTGNCWQTAIACIVEVDPERLPSQVAVESADRSYHPVIDAYLGKHHGLATSVLYKWMIPAVTVKDPGWHLINGFTERSATNGGRRHYVVGRYGEQIWDPHPSRAGIVEVESWTLIIPWPAFWEARNLKCECPTCAELDGKGGE